MSLARLHVLLASKAAFGCLLIVLILAMSVIDIREMILPNGLNWLLAAGGVGQAVFLGLPRPADAVLGAALAFVVLSTIASLFRRVRGVDGLGLGDQKFSATAGLWIGWDAVPPMLLVASCSALLFVAIRSMRGDGFDRASRLPFGPFLGIGTVVCWPTTIAVRT